MEIRDPKLWTAFEKYCEWLSLPRHFNRLTPEQRDTLPADIIELTAIKYKKDFCEKFCVTGLMLSDWDKHPDLRNMVKQNWKKWCKSLTPNVMGKFYEKLMEEGDAGRMKLWMSIIEDEGKEDGVVNVNVGLENILKSMQADGDLKQEPGKEIR